MAPLPKCTGKWAAVTRGGDPSLKGCGLWRSHAATEENKKEARSGRRKTSHTQSHPLVPPVISPKELGCTVSTCSKNKGTWDWERGEERCLTEAEPGEGREKGIFLIVWGLVLFCFHLLSTLNSDLKFYVNWQITTPWAKTVCLQCMVQTGHQEDHSMSFWSMYFKRKIHLVFASQKTTTKNGLHHWRLLKY